MRQLKLIWDFKGPEALPTAKHHLVHLNEFITKHQIEAIASDIEQLNEMHSIAYVAVEESVMPVLRDALKPHRGQLWEG